MDLEMRAHLERETAQNLARGMSPAQARAAARRAFGGIDRIQELERDARAFRWLDDAMRDFRYAARSLRKSPVFTAVCVLSLALGIGAGAAVFSVLNAVLLRALPVRAPHELRLINWVGANPKFNNYTGTGTSKLSGGREAGSSFSYPAFRAFQERSAGLASVFGFFFMPRITAVARGEAAAISGLMVSGNFFADYGASTLLGRPLTADDDQPGAAPVAVITYAMWERRFGLDPHVLGQTVLLNQNAFTVVGVLPRDYVGPLPGDMAECYVAFAAQPVIASNRPMDSVNQWWVQPMARIARDADEKQLQAALAIPFRQALAASRSTMEQPDILLQRGAQGAGMPMREEMAKPLRLLLAIVGLVIAIACANVAGLLLARGAAREHEYSLRAAIGAGRGRLVRQSLAESLLLSLTAAAGGLLLAHWGRKALLQIYGELPDSFRIDPHTDWKVLTFALGVSVLTALVFGLLPALRASRVDPLAGLKSRSALTPSRLRIGKVLVAAQVGISVLLVAGAGLMIRTLVNLVHVDPGFNPGNILLFRLEPAQAGYSGAAFPQFFADARRSLEAIPGVRSVALSSHALASNSTTANAIEIPDRPASLGEHRVPRELAVSDGFFETFGIPIVLGRAFGSSDTRESAPVAVVNETFARAYFPGEYPLGRTFLLQHDRSRTFTIVGVSGDAKYASIREAIPPVMYLCSGQLDRRAMYFAVRSALPPLSLVPAARQAIAAINPNLPLSAIRTQEQLVDRSIAQDRLFAGLCSGLAALALALASIGLYGLMSYHVSRRAWEFGVRLALGATPSRIAGPILREAALLAAAGLAAGAPAALVLTRLIRAQLYGVDPHDPATIAGAVLLLVAVAVLAAWIPARRASRVDPLVALRAE